MSPRVCLVNPPHPYLRQPRSQAPLGLLYVAAALRQAGIEPDFVDLSDRRYNEEYELPAADLYGITATVIDRPGVLAAARAAKCASGGKGVVVVGGPITLTPQHIESPEIDTIVRGEGERAVLDVVADLPRPRRLYEARRIRDLDELPFPARDLLSVQGGNVFAFNRQYLGSESTVLITSRGCPFSCAFCASPGIWLRKVTYRSVENVLAEVDEIIGRFGVRQLRFSDDTLTLRRDRLQALCDGLGRRGVVWRASIRVKPSDPEMFRAMYASGCREVSLGVESGDQDVLDRVGKSATVEDNRIACLNAKAAGLVVRVLFMIGVPGESTHTVDRNIAFFESVRDACDTVALTRFVPIPGSAIAMQPERYGARILESDIDQMNFYCWSGTEQAEWSDVVALDGLSLEQLRANRERMRAWVISSGKSNRG